MPACPAGHDSAATDFCDICGMRIGSPSSGSPSSGSPSSATPSGAPSSGTSSSAAAPDAPAEPCPRCGGARSGRFCEACGFDSESAKPAHGGTPAPPLTAPPLTGAPLTGAPLTGAPPTGAPLTAAPPTGAPLTGPPGSAARAAWTAVVTADRAYFDSVVAAGGPDAAALRFPAYCPDRRFVLSGREMRIGRRSVSRGLQPEIDLTGPPEDPGISHLHAVLIAEPDGSWAVLDPGSANGTQVNGGDIAAGTRVPLRSGDRIGVGAWTVLTIRAA
jgi:hypothetical protein